MFFKKKFIKILLVILFLFFTAQFVSATSLSKPQITDLSVPLSAKYGKSFEVKGTAKSIIGVKSVIIKYQNENISLPGNGTKLFNFVTKLKAKKIGLSKIQFIALDIHGTKSEVKEKNINIIGSITIAKGKFETIKKSTVNIHSFKNPKKYVPIIFSVSAHSAVVIVGQTAKFSIKTNIPAPAGGLIFDVSIKDSSGNPAYSFDKREFTQVMPQGSYVSVFTLKSSKHYSNKVDMYVSLSRNTRKLSLSVIQPAEIQDLKMDGEGDADVVTIKTDTNKKCTILLDKPSTPGGTKVTLSKEGPDATHASIQPDSIIIPEGENSGIISLQTRIQATKYYVVKAKTFSKSSVLTVNIIPDVQLSSFKLVPFHFHQGQSVEGVVKLSANAHTGGQLIKLFKTEYGAQFVTMPEQITIPEGMDEGKFNVQISKDAKPKSKVSFTAYLSSQDKIKQPYTILPFKLIYFAINPPLMEKQESSLKLKISGPAPEGGLACLMKIRTPLPNDNWAYGFDNNSYRFTFLHNTDSVTIPLKSDREYPKGVDIIISCSSNDIYSKKHFPVTSVQRIKTFTVVQPIAPGRIGLGTVVLNRPDHEGNITKVTITNLSESAKNFVEIPAEVIVPINQHEISFMVKVLKEIPNDRFFLKASLPSGESESIEVKIKR